MKATLPMLAMVVLAASAPAEPVVYTDPVPFLDALSELPYETVHEGFESDIPWGSVRSTIPGGSHTLPAVSHLGVVWTSNNSTSQVTTSEGAALTGEWGFYSLPHGSYANPESGSDCSVPGACGDGFRVRADEGVLFAIGGWFRTNTPFAKLAVFLGQYPENRVDLGETCDPSGENCESNGFLGTQARFIGILDPSGFSGIEFREMEGTAEDTKLIFADDFSFAGSATQAPVPPSLWHLY